MILHTVIFTPKPNTETELAAVMQGLGDLRSSIPGFETYQHGPNIDLEEKSQGYSYGFTCGFADQSALEAYAIDPDHLALGARLVALSENGVDGLMVIDLDTGAGVG